MKTRLAFVILSLVLSILIGITLHRGKTGNAISGPKRPLIGLSMDTLEVERWKHDRDLFVARAKELGADVLVVSANGNDTRQIRDCEALISNGIDALVIIPHDGAAMAKSVELAHEAGIPALAYDRLILNCDLDLYLTFDNIRVGELQAGYLVEKLKGRKARIVRLLGSKTDNNAFLFKQGQDNILDPAIARGDIEIVHEDWCDGWRPENAKKAVNAAITKAGHNIDAILCSADILAAGAIQVLLEEGLAGKVLVTGQDADLTACQRIVEGTQTMSIYKPIKNLANTAAELAVKMAKREVIVAKQELTNGKINVPSIFLPVHVVDKDSMESLVIADGFHTRESVYKN
jgi:D-xylose transport system substrate-binding protein|uniref:sugar ABC transporter substrate-binding protein n=1 Tax=Cephaloticoccus sp. TaxID=1985742 RepID=UPI00404A7DEB